MSEPKKLFLLDAMALIYRAYFAFSKNPRINSKGMNTSAVFGFANTLYDVLKNEKPTHIGVAFDTVVPTKRHEVFVEYKAQREKMPEDLAVAIPFVRRLLEGFYIPILYKDGYEADDVIGTLARKAAGKGFNTYMMTPDKDFGQLVTENIFIYKPGRAGDKAEVMGVKEVCEKYGIERPEQVIDILGLWGDASDNIPGIPGIGEKRSKELISEYGTLEKVLENTDKFKGKIRENLEAFRDQGIQSKELATIITDVPIEFEEDMLLLSEPDRQALKELFDELEFRTFAQRIFTDLSVKGATISGKQGELFSEKPEGNASGDLSDITSSKHQYHRIDTPEQRTGLLIKLSKAKVFCFDTETTGKDPQNAELVGMSFALERGEAFFVSLPENYDEARNIVQEFKEVFENESISKIGQNIKYDISMLKWYDVEVKGKLFDTMIAHYLLQPDMKHNMDVLAETYLRYKTVSYDELTEKNRGKQLELRTVQKTKPERLADYACEDADITLQLKHIFEPELKKTGTFKVFDQIEVPLIPVLASMEAEGVRIDIQALKDYSLQLEKEIKEIEGEIHEKAGHKFNIASPKQLGEVLFEKLNITDNARKTKTKQFSTAEDVLQKLVNKHPIIQNILDYRSLTKLKSTYVDTLPNMVNPRTGRIHTSYNQAVAATGRLSSDKPNLQNIPIRTEKGREIRRAFIPRNKSYTLLSADYSQVELRIIAQISSDKGMIEAFSEGLDIHTSTASKVYDVTPDQVTKEMRRNAKMVNFGIVYGISAFGLSERLNIPRNEAKYIIDQYFETYPGVKNFMNNTILEAREKGYVETIMGRKRYIRDINSANAVVRGFAERNAINAPIQGSSADMIKIAMINIYNAFLEKNLKSKMILQVHDELVFDVFNEEIDIVKPIVEKLMINAIPLEVPIEVEMSIGQNWLEAH